MFNFRQRSRAGKPYEGPAAWCDDYQLVPRPGFYALDVTGKKLLRNVPLVYVDDAGDDPWDGSGHYEFAGPKDNPQRVGRRVPPEARKIPPADARPDIVEHTAKNLGGRVVEFEVVAVGESSVSS